MAGESSVGWAVIDRERAALALVPELAWTPEIDATGRVSFEERDGYRYTAHATPTGQLTHLDARHRAHARIEDGIRCGEETGLATSPAEASRSTPPGSPSCYWPPTCSPGARPCC